MFNSIKTKMVIINSLLILMLLAGSLFLTYNYSRNLLQESIYDSAIEGAKYNAKIVNLWMQLVVDQVETIADTDAIRSMDWTLQREGLVRIANEQDYIETIVVSDLQGNFQITEGSNNGNISERPYFKKVLQTKQVAISDPIVSKATGNRVIAIAGPIINHNQVEGVLVATIQLSFLQNIVKDMKINGYGFGWILNYDKVTIAHPVEKYLGNAKILDDGNEQLRNIATRMANQEIDTAEYQLNGTNKFLAFAPVEIGGWSVAMGAALSDVLSPLAVIRNIGLVTGLIAILVGILVAYFVASSITKGIIDATAHAQLMATNDLSMDVPDFYLVKKDEIGILANAFDKMTQNFRSMIGRIANSSDQVAAFSEELSASGEQLGKAVEQVGAAIQNMASGANEQSNQINQIQTNVQGFVAQIEEVTKNADTMSRSATNVMNSIDKGNESVEASIEKIMNVKKDAEEASTVVKQLGDTSDQIGQIIELINGIAEQTNLLALNAAIEAARAGEAGRGFSIVADEIRGLAEESGKATGKITDLIGQIRNGIQNAVQKMDRSVQSVDSSVHAIETNGDIFTEIKDEAVNLAEIIDLVTESAKKMEQDSRMVQDAMNDISQMSQDFAANSEDVAASSEEQNASTEEIISAANQLAEMANDLSEIVGEFKIS